jgi:hypothetical protein
VLLGVGLARLIEGPSLELRDKLYLNIDPSAVADVSVERARAVE